MASPQTRFVPDKAGFDRMRNCSKLQQLCLNAAQGIAQRARHGRYGFRTDVRPGKKRCWARATWSPSEYLALQGKSRYFESLRQDPAKKALENAARGYKL